MASVWSHGLITLVIAHFLLQEHSFVLVNASSNVHIVYMGDKRYDEPELVRDSHHAIVSTILGSKEAAQDSILYSYRHGFSGFAVVLTPSQAKQISGFPGVIRVIPNKILNLQTTRSWDFLHVKPQIANGILSEGQSGRGSIIGVLDTGIWPESKSFVDDGMAEVPSRWRGICQEGEKFSHSNCNRKIIGARWYIKGYEAEFGKLNKSDGVEFLSPRDASGHGTHTSSTAAGAIVENASYMGLAEGFARGGAPSAWLAVYKVCWSTGGCSSADLLAAFDDAIFDGVDLLSVSIGSPPPLSSYVDDLLAMGSFHAVARGIPVICSSGNSGPYSQTVTNTAPWMITVAASTMDRAFPTVITMGNNQTIVGQAIYTGEIDDKFYPIVYGEDILSKDADESDARTCLEGSLNETLVVGKVVLCFQSRSLRSATTVARTIQKLQGVGLIFSQFPAKDVIVSSLIPCVQVDFELGTHLLAYMATTRNPVVKLSKTKTVVGQQISPEVAFFSSRGPSSLSPTVLKPDIAAPGVNILASWSAASPAILVKNSQNQDHRQDFRIESGTSMSCPHISGIVSLIKAIHPTWSPAAISYFMQQNFYEDMLEYEDMPEYKDMLKLWPSLYNKYSSTKKCWNFHCIKNKVGLECKNDSYLALATGYGKKWINHFLDELRNQKEYDFGSNEMYSCKNFELWVNRIFKHKVDCRFYRLPYDERYFGLKEIGILGKLYLDDLTWELVDLVVPEASVKIDDESKFDLQDFHQSTWLQLRNQKMEDEDI